jgi:hypothetical protein
MDIQPQATTQPISDDQELAKALAGVMPDAPDVPAPAAEATPSTPPVNPMQFEETPTPAITPAAMPTPSASPITTPSTQTSTDLDNIKKDALGELRPLIDKVDLPAEEKFDTYLMLIRSTDDTTLIAPAHTAAQAISDEKRRAEALLDIIKEIDYLSHGKQTTPQ